MAGADVMLNNRLLVGLMACAAVLMLTAVHAIGIRRVVTQAEDATGPLEPYRQDGQKMAGMLAVQATAYGCCHKLFEYSWKSAVGK